MEDVKARWRPENLCVTRDLLHRTLLVNGMRMEESPIMAKYPTLWQAICTMICDFDVMTPKQLLSSFDDVFEDAMNATNMLSLAPFGGQRADTDANDNADDDEAETRNVGDWSGFGTSFLSFEDALTVLGDLGRVPPGPLLEAVLIAWAFGMCVELGSADDAGGDDSDDDEANRNPEDLKTEEIMKHAASMAFVLCKAVFARRLGAIQEALRLFIFNARVSHSRCVAVTKSLNDSMDACLSKMTEAAAALHLLMAKTLKDEGVDARNFHAARGNTELSQ